MSKTNEFYRTQVKPRPQCYWDSESLATFDACGGNTPKSIDGSSEFMNGSISLRCPILSKAGNRKSELSQDQANM